MRVLLSSINYKALPRSMFIELVLLSYVLTITPPSGRVSNTRTPKILVIRTTLDYNRHFRVKFGAYC